MTPARKTPSRKIPPRITRSYLENASLHYLERFSSSRANLRRVLMRKVSRSLAHWAGEEGDEPGRDEATALVDAVLAWLQGLGYLDDERYAASKASSLRAKGRPEKMVRAHLASKGVESDHIDKAFDDLAAQGDGGDMAAALVFCRRRKLGPYRRNDRAGFRQKDLAALGRAGFGWSVAVQAVDSDEPDLCIR